MDWVSFLVDPSTLAAALAAITGATLGYLSEGANAAGAALAGALPHRGVGGKALSRPGADARAMLETPRKAYVLFGIEPGQDLADGERAHAALKAATVVCFTPFVTDELLDCADVLLPIGTFAETAGTFVNAEGRWQSFDAAADLAGDARPGWRVLRVLGNELELPLRMALVREAADRQDERLASCPGQGRAAFLLATRSHGCASPGVLMRERERR